MAKRKALYILLPIAPQLTILIVISLEGYGSIALSIWVLCPIPAESSVHLPASCLVVPILIATQEIHYGTYIASHVVSHNAPVSHQENEVLPPTEGPFLHIKYLGKKIPDFWIFLINYHT